MFFSAACFLEYWDEQVDRSGGIVGEGSSPPTIQVIRVIQVGWLMPNTVPKNIYPKHIFRLHSRLKKYDADKMLSSNVKVL
jgi:hypothetical protein